jgi:hypothetical protein
MHPPPTITTSAVRFMAVTVYHEVVMSLPTRPKE